MGIFRTQHNLPVVTHLFLNFLQRRQKGFRFFNLKVFVLLRPIYSIYTARNIIMALFYL
jgi:hypothetical protein